MNILEYNLSASQKNFLKDIIDFYEKSVESFEKSPTSPISSNGLFLNSCFYDDNYMIKPVNDGNKLAIQIEFISELNGTLSDYRQLCYDIQMTSIIKIKFVERLHFIKRLWDNNLIYLVGNLDGNLPKVNYTKRDKECHKRMNISCILSPLNSQEYFDFLSKYYMAQVIPSETLIDFCKNDYTTIEERRFKIQQATNTQALNRAKIGNRIAVGIAIVSIIINIICAIKIPISINEEQYIEIKELLKTTNNGKTKNAES